MYENIYKKQKYENIILKNEPESSVEQGFLLTMITGRGSCIGNLHWFSGGCFWVDGLKRRRASYSGPFKVAYPTHNQHQPVIDRD